MKELRIVCSGPPSASYPGDDPGDGYCAFLEIEDETGKSVNVGDWRERKDGLWELVIDVDTIR